MENTTPMLRQYLEIKKQYPGTLLFFRLGDFYELFDKDALVGARELNITLTARHKDSKNPIPMCGVPHHAAASYISKLVKKGYRVAICEQTEIPGKTTKLVKREVVRVITPGTAIDQQLIEANESVYLASICGTGETFGAAFLELSTGEFFATQVSGSASWAKIRSNIESFAPRELLFPEPLRLLIEDSFGSIIAKNSENSPDAIISPPLQNVFFTTLTAVDDYLFNADQCEQNLIRQLGVRELSGFGLHEKHDAIRAAGACLNYAKETQRVLAEHISEIGYFEENDFMILDSVTLKNLEVVESRTENNRRTLLAVIDKTVTGMGARLLRGWVLRPSIKRTEIQTRLSSVTELTDSILRGKIRLLLKKITDLERLTGRLNLNTATPRDLVAFKFSLSQIPEIVSSLSDAQSLLLQVLSENIHALPEIRNLVETSITDEPPANLTDGNVIREGFNQELDELRSLLQAGKQTLAGFEESEKERTGIYNLKLKFNNVYGYFIEISKGNLSRVPPDYQRRQTLTNAERFTTPQLKGWEEKILGAEDRIKELENQIFSEVRLEVTKETKRIQSTARALATLDALASLAEVATERNYTPPILHDGDEIEIKNGRHAIVETLLQQTFIPNDIYLNNSTDRLLIITGPNMGGKSTILRQIALIQILGQIGSFVPASFARLPIVDRVWTRVGASDDLAGGRSTFMVEMTETAAILNNATPRSLVLLDEIGRGTSTFDGLSIAWSVAEYLHNSPEHSAKTLFATHYHELTELAEKLPGARNFQVTAIEKDGEVIFLHKIKKGKASKSYGIAVAQLAGLPAKAISRAKEVLSKLEQYELAVFAETKERLKNSNTDFIRTSSGKMTPQFSLFAISNETVINELREAETEKMSDKELKEFILDIKSKIV